MADVDFAQRLSVACSLELSKARLDPDRMGAMIERLVHSLAFTISTACQGDPDATNNMLEGASAYLFATATDFQKVSQALASLPRKEGE